MPSAHLDVRTQSGRCCARKSTPRVYDPLFVPPVGFVRPSSPTPPNCRESHDLRRDGARCGYRIVPNAPGNAPIPRRVHASTEPNARSQRCGCRAAPFLRVARSRRLRCRCVADKPVHFRALMQRAMSSSFSTMTFCHPGRRFRNARTRRARSRTSSGTDRQPFVTILVLCPRSEQRCEGLST